VYELNVEDRERDLYVFTSVRDGCEKSSDGAYLASVRVRGHRKGGVIEVWEHDVP